MSARRAASIETRQAAPADIEALRRDGWVHAGTTTAGRAVLQRRLRTAFFADWRDERIAELETELRAARVWIEHLEGRVLPPRLERIVDAVAQTFCVPASLLFNETRARSVSWPRQACFRLAFVHGRADLERIGRAFNRDHSTVSHGIRHAKELIDRDEDFAVRYRAAEQLLGLRPEQSAGS